LLSHRLSLSSRCALRLPLVLSSRRLVVALPLDTPPSRRLVVFLSRRAASRCLVAQAGCCAIISCRHLVAPPSRPLIVLAGCCVACLCTALSSSCRSPSPTPLNALKRCCRHRTPPSPPPLNAVSIVQRCHCSAHRLCVDLVMGNHTCNMVCTLLLPYLIV
jgi:hypothetical protein